MTGTLLVASTDLPPFCGGAELVAWEIARRVSNKFDVHFITTSTGTPDIENFVEVHTVPRRRWMPITYSTLYSSEIKKVMMAVSPDIIHCHMTLPWGFVLRNVKPPRVITCHGSEVRKRYGKERYFIQSAMRHATVITSPCKWLADYIEKEYGRKSVIIPNGVDLVNFKPMTDIQRSDNAVLYVGRFNRNKGALDLVEAARALPEYQFWFRGSDRNKPANVGKQGIKIPSLPNVKTIGFIPDEHALAELYNRATICAFPSQYEVFPLVGLEAMACGRTVVATIGPRNGFVEYVENGRDGILIEPHDIKGLVKSIQQLMENKPERLRLEKSAREKAAKYDWDIIVDRYRVLLEELMHR
jgi:glycosyltransferase involved in cell wall biosynthesis